MTGLLTLPPEIRLIIFNLFLRIALNSRHNEHLRLLQTCTQIAAEAGPIVRQYLCLKDESQIRGLLFDAPGAGLHSRSRQRFPSHLSQRNFGGEYKDLIPGDIA